MVKSMWTGAAALALAVPLASREARAEYKTVEVQGGGTVEVRVIWTGAAPSDRLSVNQDQEICDRGKLGYKTSPRLQVGADGGVKNAVVHLEAVPEGKAFPAQMQEPIIDQRECEYSPHIMLAKHKSELKLTSNDALMHNVHMAGAALYNLPIVMGKETKRALRKPGLIEITCDAGHGWMSAYIHVVEHPYYAVTDASGRITLDDVPPGKYVVKMWHEGWQITEKVMKGDAVSRYVFAGPVEQSKPVEITGGTAVKIDFELK